MIKIGDLLWKFDINRRIYREPNTIGGGGPIYSEHFQSARIVGETPQSWLVGSGHKPHKVNKKTMLESCGSFSPMRWHTADSMANDIWIHENRADISKRVLAESSVGKLKRIKMILDEKEICGALNSTGRP